EATQPARYLACLISRLGRGQSTVVQNVGTDRHSSTAPGLGVFYDSVEVTVVTNPRLQGRSRDLLERAADITRFYGSLLGDYPYPAFSVALIEKDLPGGHSPP